MNYFDLKIVCCLPPGDFLNLALKKCSQNLFCRNSWSLYFCKIQRNLFLSYKLYGVYKEFIVRFACTYKIQMFLNVFIHELLFDKNRNFKFKVGHSRVSEIFFWCSSFCYCLLDVSLFWKFSMFSEIIDAHWLSLQSMWLCILTHFSQWLELLSDVYKHCSVVTNREFIDFCHRLSKFKTTK